MKEKERERGGKETPPWNVNHCKYRRSQRHRRGKNACRVWHNSKRLVYLRESGISVGRRRNFSWEAARISTCKPERLRVNLRNWFSKFNKQEDDRRMRGKIVQRNVGWTNWTTGLARKLRKSVLFIKKVFPFIKGDKDKGLSRLYKAESYRRAIFRYTSVQTCCTG